jgi:membrane-bound lytic murein transglycosylase D
MIKNRLIFLITIVLINTLMLGCSNTGYKRYSDESKPNSALGQHKAKTSDKSGSDSKQTEAEEFEGEFSLERVNQSAEEIFDSLYADSNSNIIDLTVAVDDYVNRELSIANEYYTMGVLANRETAWEEAEYYFEKALSILGELDIDSESDSLTMEAARYNQLLANIITNYRMTLLSLGHLPGDVSADALLARFSEINHIKVDSSEFNRLETYAQEQVIYNMPVILNERVKNCILYYQTVARDAFQRYLSRSTIYASMIDSIFIGMGIPTDMKYLALVESGFNPKAYSWARAMGLWQFIASTGRMYKLNRSWWYDERRDPIKSTIAAANFLNDLYQEFGSWELAMAAYNGGPGRVRKTIRNQKTTDFWKMKLRKQTMDYVPFFMAATIICKNPEKFGFDEIEYLPEWEFDLVNINKCLDLKTIGKEIGCSVDDLKNLNPELLRQFTPPNMQPYPLRIPKGKKNKFLAAYEKMPSSKETSFVRHKINRGETVSTIARKYGVSQYAIFEANNLNRRSKIYAGKEIVIPVPNDRSYSSKKNKSYETDGDVYVVKGGDTVWDIARAFSTTPEYIRRANKLDRRARIYVGQKLKVGETATLASTESKVIQSSGKKSSYTVKKGDTLWDIAKRFGTTTGSIRRLNGLQSSSRIFPGQKLTVSGNVSSTNNYEVYTVKRGDTLWEIAAVYNTTVNRIKAWNNVNNPRNIKAGDRLIIYAN